MAKPFLAVIQAIMAEERLLERKSLLGIDGDAEWSANSQVQRGVNHEIAYCGGTAMSLQMLQCSVTHA
jgi:hypothetical protein